MLRLVRTATVFIASYGMIGCTMAVPPLETRQDRFINVVRVLADSGRLVERAEVERLLQTSLEEVRHYSSPNTPGECEKFPNAYRLYETITYQSPPGFWFKETLNGRPKMFVPGWLGPGGPVGKPSLGYTMKRELRCSESPLAKPKVSADLSFNEIPAFSCVGEADLQRALPQARFSPATDGAWIYHYEVPSKDTWVSFDFVYPPECMLSVQIEQSPRVRKVRTERE